MQVDQLISLLQAASANPPTGEATIQHAQQYVDLCQGVNARLASCTSYLQRSMISEGLRIADTEPQLLDLCAKLDFVGVENWAQMCRDRKWPVASPIDAKAIEEINNAFTSGLVLEPLLKEYRLAVRTGNTRECIRLLRHLNDADKEGASWKDDLRNFEKKRWAELRSEYDRAKKQDNPDVLAALLIEINGEWITPIDEALKNDVRNTVRSIYARQALGKAKRIAAEISAAYSAFKYESVEAGLNEYANLAAEGYLSPSSEVLTQVQEATDWYRGEKKSRDEKYLYEETIQRLRNAVEAGKHSELDEILNILTRYDQVIPDRLEERAKALLDDHKLSMARKRTRTLVLSGICAIIALSAVAGYVARIKMNEVVSDAVVELEGRFNAEEIAAFSAAIVAIQAEHPKAFNREEIQAWVKREPELRSKLEAKQVAFDGAIKQLESLRADGYQADANQINGLIQLAKDNALPGESRGRIAVIAREWEAYQLKVQGEIDRAAMDIIQSLESECAKLVDGVTILETEQKKRLEEYVQLISEAKAKQALASDAVLSRYDALVGKLNKALEQWAQKTMQYEEILKSGNLDKYLEAMITYARAFPNDRLSDDMKPIVTEVPIYRQIVELPKNAVVENALWSRDARLAGEQLKIATEQWPELKNALMSLEYEKRYVEMWQSKHREGGVIYFEGRPERVFVSTGIPGYQGMVYRPRASDVQPNFSLQTIEERNIFGTQLMPHCEFVKGLISLGRFSEPKYIETHLRDKMQSLYETNTINPLLKLRMMDMLARYHEKLINPQETVNWTAFRAELQSIDPELHWLCVEHRDVKMANDRAQTILDKWFKQYNYARKLDFTAALRDAALNRHVRWAGFISLHNPRQIEWRGGDMPDEVLVVRSVSGIPKVYLAEEVIKGERKRYIKYMPGEPVFTPTDNRTTRQILSELKGKYGIASVDGITWPLSWPDNFRK